MRFARVLESVCTERSNREAILLSPNTNNIIRIC